MDLKDAINYLQIGIRQMPYSTVSYDTLVESLELVESKLQFAPPTNMPKNKIKLCTNKECIKYIKDKRKFKDGSNCSIFLKTAMSRCENYKEFNNE